MKTYVLVSFILLSFCSSATFGQADSISVAKGKSYIDKHFNVSKEYYKSTDIQMPKETFHALMNANPNLFLERVIDDAGTITRYLYDPQHPLGVTDKFLDTHNVEKRNFPNFRVTTIANEDIELNKLKGKFVIVRFE